MTQVRAVSSEACVNNFAHEELIIQRPFVNNKLWKTLSHVARSFVSSLWAL